MKIGDRVQIVDGARTGMVGVIIEPFRSSGITNAWWVLTDTGKRVDVFDHQARVIGRPEVKSDVLEMAQRNRESMLNEIDQFRAAAEKGTLGDFSELGFLFHLLQALTKD